MHNKKLQNIKRLIESAENSLRLARTEIAEISEKNIDLAKDSRDISLLDEENIIEGTFDGENMQGDDQKSYPVPANYASKSKLVEGDKMKLIIAEDGAFIFKQIGPVERKKLLGELFESNGNYLVKTEEKTYKVIAASITYFKGKAGDEVAIVVPKESESDWAAVEAIIPKIS